MLNSIGYATSTDGIHWEKYENNPVLIPSETWEGERVLLPKVIIGDSTFQMWYAGLSPSPNSGFKVGYATSPDGINWTKYENNPVFDRDELVAEQNSVQPASVIRKDSLFQMWYSDYHSGHHWYIGYAESADGINWDKYEHNPVLDVGGIATWEGFHVAWPMILFDGTSYRMWYTGLTSIGGSKSRIGYATSKVGDPTWVSSEENFQNPEKFQLFQNHPNPFNPETEISFQLPEASRVQITIYNIRGQVIRRLADHSYQIGVHVAKWDGQDEFGASVLIGVYLYQMQARGFATTRKMILAR